MVIIGVLAAAVTLSIRGRSVDDKMQSESRRLEELLRMASDEAQAKGVEIGLRHTTDGFEFVTPDASSGKWKVIDDGMFRRREVPEPFFLELRVDGRLLPPVKPAAIDKDAEETEDGKEGETRKQASSSRKSDADKDKELEPQVLVLSSGEMTAFTLDMKMKDVLTYYRVEGNALGELSSRRLGDKAEKKK